MTLKRTALKRGSKQLKTYQPLRRFTELRRTPRLRCGTSDGDGTPEGGAPRRRSRGHQLPVDVVAIVRERSGGWCEIQLDGVCSGRATQRHHRITQKAGGRHGAAARRSDLPSDLLDLCWHCHDVVTNYPARAYTYGFSLREGQESTAETVIYRGDLSYIDDAGGVHSFEKAGT